MSINKFKFVSPGVFINEVDESILPRIPEEMGPVVIGRSLRGPAMRPVKVADFAEFVETFGEPHPGGLGGDVWRDGNKTAPTYGVYAAQAYLKNSGPLTFIRLAGYQNDDSVTGGEAGWSMDDAYGIFFMPITGSNNVYTSVNGGATASLGAVIYATGSGTYGLIGIPLSGSTETVSTATTGTFVRCGSNLEFKVVVNGVTKIVNFDEDSKKYIRSVLNTNPILTNKNIVADGTEQYFLGPTHETFVYEKSGNATDFAAVMVKLGQGALKFSDFKKQADDAASGWVVSQHKGKAEDFVATEGVYPVQKLFRVVSLTEGQWNTENIKISIEDIKEPINKFVKFGSFTLSVRKMGDNDLTPQYLERFSNLNLDPTSENFIARRIGDKYSEWVYAKKAFEEYGTYNNKSKYIRVEVDSAVEAGLTDTDLLPFGYYGQKVYSPSSLLAGSKITVSPSNVQFIQTEVTGNQVFTASFALPTAPLLKTSADAPVSSFGSVFFGLKTNIDNTKRFNKDVLDTIKAHPNTYAAATASYLFTLDDLSGSIKNGSFDVTKAVKWNQGNRSNGTSLTAIGSSSVIFGNLNRFTMPLCEGFDGVDITEKDPFCTRRLYGNEYENYAFNSVKVAIESIADPEVVEINLATVPGVTKSGLTSLLIDKCETRGDALAIVDLEGDYDPEKPKRKPSVAETITAISSRNINSSYGCAFFPWVLIRDNLNNNTVWVPPSVAALGTFSSSQKKTELWFAPAGFNRGGLTDGAAGIPVLQTSLRVTSKNRDDLYTNNINPIATFPSEGIVVFGQKTLQAVPSALDRINVRRLMIYLKKEISRMAKTVLFDPNIDVTWKRFTDQANPFLASVKSRFGLSEFKVVLDGTTTTPDLVDRNIVYAKILLKPTRAIEFIALDFVITSSGASFAD